MTQMSDPVNRRLLEKARDMGYNAFLAGKLLYDSIPWPDNDDYRPYRNQMISSYMEAQAMFKDEQEP